MAYRIATDYFIGRNSTPVSVASSPTFNEVGVPIDQIIHASSSFTMGAANLGVNLADGFYLVIFTAFLDSGTIGTGQLIVDTGGALGGIASFLPGFGAALDNNFGTATCMDIGPAVSKSVTPLVSQNSGSTLDVNTQLTIVRLGN